MTQGLQFDKGDIFGSDNINGLAFQKRLVIKAIHPVCIHACY